MGQPANMKVFICLATGLATGLAAPAPVIAHPVAHAVGYAAGDALAEVSPYNYNYSVALPDRRTQTVNYNTNDYDGYVADVSYDGVPTYAAAPAVVAHPAVAHPVVAHPAVAHPVVAHPVAHAV